MPPSLVKLIPSISPENRWISRDHELEQYVHSFTVSSDRVRRLILISLVASVLTFVAYWNTLPFNWLDARTSMARIAYRNRLWDNPESRLKTCRAMGGRGQEAARFVDTCDSVAENVGWVLKRRHSEASLKAHLEKLEQLRAERSLLVKVPWLGVDFDINDLGAFSAISLSLLSMTLCFAMSRQHENLYLCLWKVRRLADREGRDDDGQSEANFLYHALAMAQVFTRPPTLARWRPSFWGRLAVRSLLFVPLAAQLLVTITNAQSFEVARGMNPWAATLSMSIQVLFLLLLIFCTLPCFVYSRASDIRWRETFFAINPRLRSCARTPWFAWTKLCRAPHWGFATDDHGNLYVGQPFDGAGHLGLQRAWTAWKIFPESWEVTRLASVSALPDCVRKVTDKETGVEYRFQPLGVDRAISVLVRVAEGHVWPIAGGRGETIDGVGPAAGFRSPRALLYDTKRRCLYAIDGACLRRIDPDTGEVRTLGDSPLGGKPRLLWPHLLGLAADGERLLIADYDERCVRALGHDGSYQDGFRRSRGGWSPAGVAVHNGSVYILEHRALMTGRFLGYIRPWGRIWLFPKPDLAHGQRTEPRLLLKISRRGAKLVCPPLTLRSTEDTAISAALPVETRPNS